MFVPAPFPEVYHQAIWALVLAVDLAAGRALCEIRSFHVGNGLLHIVYVETDVVNTFDGGRSFTQILGFFSAEFQDGEIDVAVGKPDTFGTGVFGFPPEFI